MTDEELVAKFASNAHGVIPKASVEALVESVMRLEAVADIRAVMKLVATPPRAAATQPQCRVSPPVGLTVAPVR